MDHLPEELLADILRRLPPRPLAVCRSVSKDLRAAVDGHGLLLSLAHRVPRGLRGIFINYVGQDEPYFFSRRAAAAPAIDAKLSFLPSIGWREAVHHINGLLLVYDWGKLYVCNPATRRWALLPPRPAGGNDYSAAATHLAFDPTVSLHYEVISFSNAPRKPRIPVQPDIKRPSWCQSYRVYLPEEIGNLPLSLRAKYDSELEVKGSVEWPPSWYVAQVFSSRTGQWEERVFVREDDVAVTLLDVWSDPWGIDSDTLSYGAPRCNAVCWRGAFYLHCRGGFIMRLSLLEQKYQVIKTPRLDIVFTQITLGTNDSLRREGPYGNKEAGLKEWFDRERPSMHIGKSVHGIYYTALCWHRLAVWVLHEASEYHPMPEWELKHKADIRPSFLRHYLREDREKLDASWSLDRGKEGSECGWDSGDDSIINVEVEDGVRNGNKCHCMSSRMDLLGYHPSKEILFLGDCFEGFAYYLSTSKLQYLGTFYPVGCVHVQVAATHESFIYTPCMDDLLPDHKWKSTHDGDIEKEEEEDGDDEDKGEVDTDDDEDLEEEEVLVDIDKYRDLEEVEDEEFKGFEESRDHYKDEDWSICLLSMFFV